MDLTQFEGHTPGPWIVGKRHGNHRTEVLNATGGMAVASVWTHDRKPAGDAAPTDCEWEWTPHGMANTRLIAAAPALLARLREAEVLLRRAMPSLEGTYDLSLIEAYFKAHDAKEPCGAGGTR